MIRDRYTTREGPVKELDFARFSQYFTLDVLTQIGYGKAFGYVEQEKDIHSYIETVGKILPVMMLFGALPFLVSVTNTWLYQTLLAPSTGDKRGVGKLMR